MTEKYTAEFHGESIVKIGKVVGMITVFGSQWLLAPIVSYLSVYIYMYTYMCGVYML